MISGLAVCPRTVQDVWCPLVTSDLQCLASHRIRVSGLLQFVLKAFIFISRTNQGQRYCSESEVFTSAPPPSRAPEV